MDSDSGEERPVRPDRDRRVRQADRLGRILRVLRLIQGKGRWNAQAIAQELEVTERTIYRDLKALEFAGVPWYFDHAEQSYRIREDYRFPVPNLTHEEVIGQAVATAITRANDLDAAGSASRTTQKIAASADDETKELLRDAEEVICVLGLQLADHTHCRGIIQQIQAALLKQRKVVGTYSTPYQEGPIDLKLTPIRLCLIKSAWYLIAQPIDGDEPRTYRTARFQNIQVLEDKADPFPEFDVREYFGNAWAVFRGSESFDVRIRFLPQVARIVTETQWHATQVTEAISDGGVILSFQVDGLEEICTWLLTWTGQAEVLEPPELRRMVAERLRKGLELNR